MKTLIRWILILGGIAVGLSIALSVALLILIDPNDYRDEIAEAVSEQTGRTLTIKGDLSLKTFPCCGISLGQVALSNPKGWLEKDFAQIESAAVSVQIWPLLTQQELRVGKVTLDGLNLKLVTRKDGKTNWEMGDESSSSDNSSSNGEGSGLAGLDIAGVSITNGRLEYRDEITGDKIFLHAFDLETGAIVAGEDFDMEASAAAAEGLVEDVVIGLKFTATARLDAESLTLDLTNVQSDLDLQGTAVPGGRGTLTASIEKVNGLGAVRTVFEGIKADLKVADVLTRITGAGELNEQGEKFAGTLIVEPFSPRKLLEKLGEDPVITADSGVLTSYEMSGDWSLQGDKAAIENLKSRLDDSNINGWLRMTSLERSSVAMDLKIDKLNADRYMAPETKAAPGNPAAAPESDALDLPVEDLRTLDLQGRLAIGELQFSDAQLTDVIVNIAAKNGLVRLNPLTAKLYAGGYSGDVRLDVRGAKPKFTFNEVLTGVQLAALLKDTSEAQNLVGKGNARFTGTATGDSVSELLENLQGDAALDLQEGLYRGVDIWHEIRKARAQLKQIALPAAPANPQTEIKEFAGTAKFEGGMLVNKDFRAKVPFLGLIGGGAINLLTSTMDYSLQAKVTEKPTFEDGEDLSGLTGLTLPIRIKGSLEKPSVSVDLAGLATGLAKEKAKEKVTDRLIKKFGLDEPDKAAKEPAADGADPAADVQPAEKAQPEEPKDILKKGLRDLLSK